MFGRKSSGGRAAARVAVKARKSADKAAARVAVKARKSADKAAAGAAARAKSAEKVAGRAEKKAVKVEKRAVQAEKNAAKAEQNAAKAEQKAIKARKNEPAGVLGVLLSPKTATKALAVAKVVGPVLAPIALKAATTARGFLDERRAIKLGVTADQVAAYRGPTGPVGARIAALRSAVEEVRRRRTSDLQVVRFSEVAKARLGDLNTAVNTAGSMPPGRRRMTLSAVNRELNQIEADLMTYLVGTPG